MTRMTQTSDSSSASSKISTNEIENIIQRLQNEKHRSSTRRNYRSIWKNFNEFFIQLDRKPNNWEERISLYVGYLVASEKQLCTIKSYISAIKSVLLDTGIELDKNAYLLTSLTKACKLVNDKV